MKKSLITTLSGLWIFVMIPFLAFSQSDVSGLIKSSPADATKLTQAYLKPLFKGFGVGLNSGWNNTAHSKNLLRFDLRFGISGAVVPQTDETFDVNKIGLSNNIRPSNPAQTMASTLAGGNGNNIQMSIYDAQNQEIEKFTMPKGASLGIIPAPLLQGTIGLSRGVEISVRAIPKVKLGSDFGSVGMIGGGLKVELLPLISGIADKVSPVDIAVALGYTQFTYDLGLNVPVPTGSVPASTSEVKDFSNQRIAAKFSGMNTEFILSKKILVFTPFLSVGYNTAKTDVGLKGNYPIISGITPLGQKTYTTSTDPVSINQKDINGFRTNIGFQLNLAFFRIYGAYSMAEYNSFSGGIGLGIGK